jgi:hypothetical protein
MLVAEPLTDVIDSNHRIPSAGPGRNFNHVERDGILRAPDVHQRGK